MSPALQRRGALLVLVVAALLLGAAAAMTWTTVPASLTGVGRDVDLPGSVVFENSRGYAVVVLALLVGVALLDGSRRALVAAAVVGVGVLSFAQALDVAVDPGKAVGRSDDGYRLLGLDPVSDREQVRGLEAVDLPTTGWPWVSVTGTALVLAGGVLVLARGRRWEGEAEAVPDDDWWASR